MGNPGEVYIDRSLFVPVGITLLALISYNSVLLFVSFATSVLYTLLRTYWWYIQLSDTYRWVRYNVMFLVAFAIVFFFSRSF